MFLLPFIIVTIPDANGIQFALQLDQLDKIFKVLGNYFECWHYEKEWCLIVKS